MHLELEILRYNQIQPRMLMACPLKVVYLELSNNLKLMKIEMRGPIELFKKMLSSEIIPVKSF
jgi:hypothetical protein